MVLCWPFDFWHIVPWKKLILRLNMSSNQKVGKDISFEQQMHLKWNCFRCVCCHQVRAHCTRVTKRNIFHFCCLSDIWLDVPTGHRAKVPSLILPFQYGPNPPSYTFPAGSIAFLVDIISFDFFVLHVQCLIFWVSDANVAGGRNTNGPEIPINHKQFFFF